MTSHANLEAERGEGRVFVIVRADRPELHALVFYRTQHDAEQALRVKTANQRRQFENEEDRRWRAVRKENTAIVIRNEDRSILRAAGRRATKKETLVSFVPRTFSDWLRFYELPEFEIVELDVEPS